MKMSAAANEKEFPAMEIIYPCSGHEFSKKKNKYVLKKKKNNAKVFVRSSEIKYFIFTANCKA